MKTIATHLIQANKIVGNRFGTTLKVFYGIWTFWMFYIFLFHFLEHNTEIFAELWHKVGEKYGFEGLKLAYIYINEYVCLALGAITFLLVPLRKFWHLTALWFLSLTLALVPWTLLLNSEAPA